MSEKCLKEWTSRHLDSNDKETHDCRNCIRKRYALKGGEAAAKVGKENGQIEFWRTSALTKEVRQKAKETFRNTCLDRFGVESPLQNVIVQQKRKATLLERYGIENTLQLPITRERCNSLEAKTKRRKTNLERFGVEYPLQNVEIHKRAARARAKSSRMIHWRTQEELVCIGSYERAFVEWCNKNEIDFDWQIPHKMPDGRTYIVDAFIKTGEFANTWIEIKGWLRQDKRNKWDWFHSTNPTNSQLWMKPQLKSIGIL